MEVILFFVFDFQQLIIDCFVLDGVVWYSYFVIKTNN